MKDLGKLAASFFIIESKQKLAEINLFNKNRVESWGNIEFCHSFTYCSSILHSLALWQPWKVTTCFPSSGERRQELELSQTYIDKESSFWPTWWFLGRIHSKDIFFLRFIIFIPDRNCPVLKASPQRALNTYCDITDSWCEGKSWGKRKSNQKKLSIAMPIKGLGN